MNVAIYLRLSLADGDLGKGDKDESNSIENQRALLTSFVESREDLNPLLLDGQVIEYIDDGYTGTNFERPAFKKMVEDAKKKKISAIVVKDLSRIGRDYIGVGDYLEQIFPALGIRVVAVNSNYDSAQHAGNTLGLEFTVNNLINSLYSKDLSKKLKSSLRTKWRDGQTTMGRVPYGYRKSDKNPKEWELDPDAASVVKTIFEKACSGWNTTRIAKHLNEQGIPTPGAYKEKNYDNYAQWNRRVNDEEWLWEPPTVLRVLKRKVYTGCVIQGQRTRIKVGSNVTRKSDYNDVCVIENHHPAIVSEDDWETAQLVIHSPSKTTMAVPTGFSLNKRMRCGCCGLAMVYDGHGIPTIQCMHGAGVGKLSKCDTTRHPADNIEAVVLASLKKEIEFFNSVYRKMQEQPMSGAVDLRKQGKDLIAEITDIKARKIMLYESYAEEHISREQYLMEKEKLDAVLKEKEALHTQLSTLVADNSDLKQEMDKVHETVMSYGNFAKLKPEIVEQFIEQVTIFDKEHIEIQYVFEDLVEKVLSKLEPSVKETA